MTNQIARLFIISGICLGFAQAAHAISAAALDQLINSNEAVTLIDVRPNVLYRKSHIHNAINIPASTIARKKLPELGRVIVYGEGIDIELLEQTLAALNAKAGIQAEALEGGFSAWSARHSVVQSQKGLDSGQVKNLTYQNLQKLAERYESLILADLRMGDQQESLAAHFPNVRILDPIQRVQKDVANVAITRDILANIPKRNQDVLILIDDGNGFSEKVSDQLHAAGTKRLAILIGGEQALRSRGQISAEVRTTGD